MTDKTGKAVVRAAMRWSKAVTEWEQNNAPTEYEEDTLNELENYVHEACAAHSQVCARHAKGKGKR